MPYRSLFISLLLPLLLNVPTTLAAGQDCNFTPTEGLEVRYPYLDDDVEAPLVEAWKAGVRTGDEQQSYLLYVPSDLPNGPVPLMVVIHGATATAMGYSAKTHLEETAEERKFILAYPNGHRGWNTEEGSADVDYILDIVDDVQTNRCIDDRRIFGAGHSNGASMVHRLACDAGDIFAAMAPSAGSGQSVCDGGTAAEQHRNYIPMPIAFWHGTNDSVVNYQSGRNALEGWIARYECDSAPISIDDTSVYGQVETYGNCSRPDILAREEITGTPFVLKFTTFNGHDHQYPDGCGGTNFGANCYSPMPTAAEMNSQVLDFLEANPRPELIADSDKVKFEWLTVGNPGNAADATTGFGEVAKTFRIARYEVTNEQYSAFLNAKASSDPYNLYSPSMGAAAGGITRSGLPGSFTYAPRPDREHRPVNWVSYYDVLRFMNWMHNGQGDGDTETGAYTLEGGGPVVTNAITVRRNADARVFLPTEDEWYKAAYHNAQGLADTDYFLYPYRTNDVTTCSTPTDGENHANCARANADVIPKGSYPNSIGPYGTLDQGGNVWEWNVGFVRDVLPVMRGGGYYIGPETLSNTWRDQWDASGEFSFAGFRAAAPKPVVISPDLDLRDRIIAAAALVNNARDSGTKTNKIVDAIVDRLAQAVEFTFWLDSNKLVDEEGKRVFDDLRKAVKDVEKLLYYTDEDRALGEAAIAAREELVDVARILANELVAKLSDMETTNSSDETAKSHALASANGDLEEAELDVFEGDYDNAVQKYRSAWRKVDQAIAEIQ